MTVSSAQRDLTHQLGADPRTPGISKMASVLQHEEDAGGEDTETGMEHSPHEAPLPGLSTYMSTVLSPASTGYLLERTLGELLLTTMGVIVRSPITLGMPAQTPPGDPLEPLCNNGHFR